MTFPFLREPPISLSLSTFSEIPSCWDMLLTTYTLFWREETEYTQSDWPAGEGTRSPERETRSPKQSRRLVGSFSFRGFQNVRLYRRESVALLPEQKCEARWTSHEQMQLGGR